MSEPRTGFVGEEDIQQLDEVVSNKNIQNVNQKPSKRLGVKLAVVGVVLIVGFVGYHAINGRILSKISGSPQCIKAARQIIGKSWTMHYLKCSTTPMTIGNSPMSAYYLSFFSGPSRNSCKKDFASPDPGFSPKPITPALDQDECSQWVGTVVSNGQTFVLVGQAGNSSERIADPCYGGGANVGNTVKRDLYIYQGRLYDRTVYVNAVHNLGLGSCITNGTVLAGTDKSGQDMTITNLDVKYTPSPRDCFAAVAGRSVNDSVSGLDTSGVCLGMAAATYLDLSICHVTERLGVKPPNGQTWVIYPLDGTFTFGGLDAPYDDPNCQQFYADRMAWLGKCDEINDTTVKATCTKEYNQDKAHLQIVQGKI